MSVNLDKLKEDVKRWITTGSFTNKQRQGIWRQINIFDGVEIQAGVDGSDSDNSSPEQHEEQVEGGLEYFFKSFDRFIDELKGESVRYQKIIAQSILYILNRDDELPNYL